MFPAKRASAAVARNVVLGTLGILPWPVLDPFNGCFTNGLLSDSHDYPLVQAIETRSFEHKKYSAFLRVSAGTSDLSPLGPTLRRLERMGPEAAETRDQQNNINRWVNPS